MDKQGKVLRFRSSEVRITVDRKNKKNKTKDKNNNKKG